MNGRVRSGSAFERQPLSTGWLMRSTPAGSSSGPADVPASAADWLHIDAPVTVAAGLRRAGASDVSGRRLEADDWWFRCRFPGATRDAGRTVLGFDGLATIADVWLNGAAVLSTDNMFVGHELDVTALVRADNDLLIRCHALDPLLALRRPRPRWRAPLVEHQQLRWFRTSLLGHTPGWSPPAPAIGPWRDVWLESRRQVSVTSVRIRPSVRDDLGELFVSCEIAALDGPAPGEVTAAIARNGREFSARLVREGRTDRYSGTVRIDRPVRWWPHTHGEPALYDATLGIAPGTRSTSGTTVSLGRIGFRSLALERDRDDFAIVVNGVRVFCRGACWTPLDPIGFGADEAAYASALGQVAAAGMNMLRVSGATVYETDAFLDACDNAGVLLWQDFMFANMDYPDQDDGFQASAVREAEHQLARLQGRPSLAMLCGNSEASQQAAMWGAPRESWRPRLFVDTLAGVARSYCPDVPYTPSSTDGGAFPHQVNSGVTSYFGVGAYLRPLDDARRSEVRFASECLAFANIPEDATIAEIPSRHAIRVPHAAWKASTPHDLGAGWDFDDVRDHYLASLFRVDPVALRYSDHDRYLAMGRVVTGEVMAATFGEWRRARSTCRGALIWFLRDFVPGAGWGVVDARGVPKAAYYYLRRTLQPSAIFITDEGCNGLVLHVANDSPREIPARIELQLFKFGEVPVGSGSTGCTLEPHSAREISAVSLFPDFQDLSYAFRFGPPPLDLAVATMSDAAGVLGQAFHFPAGFPSARERDIGLTAVFRPKDGGYSLTVSTRGFAQAVVVDVDGFAASEQYFHLAPHGVRDVQLTPHPTHRGQAPRGTVRALNCEAATRIRLE
jgi:beta-mannosidase